MPEESYEMTRSGSIGTSSMDPVHDADEEDQLLNKEDQTSSSSEEEEDEEEIMNEDEEWAILVEEAATETTENNKALDDDLKLRLICMLITFGLMFLIVRYVILRLAGNPEERERTKDKLYNNGTDEFATTVILISIDGFKPDYLKRGLTPNLNRFAEGGIMAEAMHPAFPPSTFPNHWTLVTGLYPESHGIVGNLFYDPSKKQVFEHSNFTSVNNQDWWKGQPIWSTSKKNKMKTGSIMWPGSDVEPSPLDYLVKYNGTTTTKEKMDITLNWLDLPFKDRPQMISVYIPQIDQEGHRGGPYGAKMNTFIQEVDTSIGYFLKQLDQRNIEGFVHIVIVSDHGMSEISESKLIYYDDILSPDVLKHIQNREALPLLDLRPSPDAPKDTVHKIYQQLHNYTQSVPDPHFKVYLRKDVPDRFHYKHSDRITPIVAIPEVGYTFITHQEVKEKGGFKKGGNHGYDNLDPQMSAIFMARGPKISYAYRQGSVIAPFFNIEIYGLLTELLNIDGAPNNGTLSGDFPLLYQPPF